MSKILRNAVIVILMVILTGGSFSSTWALQRTTVPIFSEAQLFPSIASGAILWMQQHEAIAGCNGSGSKSNSDISLDSSGNIYLVGKFAGTIDFDPGPATYNLTSVGCSTDIFVSKLDNLGNFVWAKQIAGNDYEGASNVVLDAAGNIYISGFFMGTTDFDPGPGVSELTSAGVMDGFVSKLDNAGNLTWVKQFGGAGWDRIWQIVLGSADFIYTVGYSEDTIGFYQSTYINKLDVDGNFYWAKKFSGPVSSASIVLDAANNIYLTGGFQHTVDFDPGPGTYNMTSAGEAGSSDVFICKLDSNGNLMWGKQIGGVDEDEGSDITLDTNGNIFIVGSYTHTVDFDPGPGIYNLDGFGGFVNKLDKDGNFIWVRKIIEEGFSSAKASEVAVDTSGNVFMTGGFWGTADFDPGPGVYNLVSVNLLSIFVSKLDQDGNFVWAKGPYYVGDGAVRIELDAFGNVYVPEFLGRFREQSLVDPDHGDLDIDIYADYFGPIYGFASKMDNAGNLIWRKGMIYAGADKGNAIAHDGIGNSYVAGSFYTTFDADPGPGATILSGANDSNFFVTKFDSAGNFLWARSFGGFGFDSAYAITLDITGNIYISGKFEDVVDFDPGPGIYNLSSAGGTDIFVLKLDNNGNFIWARQMDGTDYESAYGMGIDGNGNIYLTGVFAGTVDFDPGVDTYNLTSFGAADIFVSKLDGNGTLIWARQMGGAGDDAAYGVAIDSENNAYLTGNFSSVADFDPGPNVYNIASKGETDIFVGKLNGDGSLVWAKGMGGSGFDKGLSIAVDGNGNPHITGKFEGTADFDSSPGTFELNSLGDADIFIAKLNNAGYLIWAVGNGSVETDRGSGIDIDSSGNVYAIGYSSYTFPSPYYYQVGYVVLDKLDTNGYFVGENRFLDPASMSNGGGYALVVDTTESVIMTGSAYLGNDLSQIESMFFLAKLIMPTFGDVSVGYWAYHYIQSIYDAGITGGCSTSPLMYCPESDVTRAQMAVFLERGLHGSGFVPPDVAPTFEDTSGNWAEDWIEALKTDGITAGCGAGNYCPDAVVTRAQMAVFLLRAKHGVSYVPPPPGGNVFMDVPSDYWASSWIEQLAVEGITGGCSTGLYCPDGPVTRDQIAVFLQRTFSLSLP